MPLRVVTLLSTVVLFSTALGAAAADLTKAVVVAPQSLNKQEKKAVEMLVDEVAKRTNVRWQVVDAWPQGDAAVVAVGPDRKSVV